MVDSLLYNRDKAARSGILSRLKLSEQSYAVLTLHRPSNVDEKETLLKIIEALREISARIPVVFPAHPRTQKSITRFGFDRLLQGGQVIMTEPLGYLDFLKLEMEARLVMTDSGGIQEETTVLNVPCITLRKNTERPITISQGTNVLAGDDRQMIVDQAFQILAGKGKEGSCPELWDGKTAERIIGILARKQRG